jgi:hypothetical protein
MSGSFHRAFLGAVETEEQFEFLRLHSWEPSSTHCPPVPSPRSRGRPSRRISFVAPDSARNDSTIFDRGSMREYPTSSGENYVRARTLPSLVLDLLFLCRLLDDFFGGAVSINQGREIVRLEWVLMSRFLPVVLGAISTRRLLAKTRVSSFCRTFCRSSSFSSGFCSTICLT